MLAGWLKKGFFAGGFGVALRRVGFRTPICRNREGDGWSGWVVQRG